MELSIAFGGMAPTVSHIFRQLVIRTSSVHPTEGSGSLSSAGRQLRRSCVGGGMDKTSGQHRGRRLSELGATGVFSTEHATAFEESQNSRAHPRGSGSSLKGSIFGTATDST